MVSDLVGMTVALTGTIVLAVIAMILGFKFGFELVWSL